MCGADATLVDHIKPHRGDKALFWNWNNWQALCTGCHSSVKQRSEQNIADCKRSGYT
ncbi:HNH endonuclease [Paracoccus versutus]|nr:HNH endonuclease [Paracoccus versutus]